MQIPFTAIFKARLLISFVVLVSFGCDSDEPSRVCLPVVAKSGYVTAGILIYDFEYRYEYVANRLSELTKLKFDTKAEISVTSFDYQSDGNIASEMTFYAGSNFATHVYYTYASKSVTTTTYELNGLDTVSVAEMTEYFSSGDAIHHARHSNVSLKVVDGNVVQYGSYTVVGTDTVDTFVEQYTYDQHRNYFDELSYRVVIPSDFIWAKRNSKNNLVHAEYIGGGWTKTYSYQYDNAGRLTRHVGAAGITVDFEYGCN
jgi:hypothetical protein